MARIDLCVVEWPDAPHVGGPRLLGRLADADLVRTACERLATAGRRELARLEPPVRLVRRRKPVDGGRGSEGKAT